MSVVLVHALVVTQRIIVTGGGSKVRFQNGIAMKKNQPKLLTGLSTIEYNEC